LLAHSGFYHISFFCGKVSTIYLGYASTRLAHSHYYTICL
jgi:hypothetical protein